MHQLFTSHAATLGEIPPSEVVSYTRTLRILGRDLVMNKVHGRVAYCTFAELCEQVSRLNKSCCYLNNRTKVFCSCAEYYHIYEQQNIRTSDVKVRNCVS